MKTVPIYTDGHKNRVAVLCGMSVLLAPSGQPQNMTSKRRHTGALWAEAS